jgi:hypothetical protein
LDSVSLLLLLVVIVVVVLLSSRSFSSSPFSRKTPRTSIDDTLKCVVGVIVDDGEAWSTWKFGVDATDLMGLVPLVAPWMSARPLLITI